MNGSELKWISKKNTYSSADVTLNIYKSHGKPVGGITFRNKANLAISSNGYVQVAVSGKRLYFKKSDKMNGYKMYGKNNKTINSKTYMVRIVHETLYDYIKKYRGDYSMKYDNELGGHIWRRRCICQLFRWQGQYGFA